MKKLIVLIVLFLLISPVSALTVAPVDIRVMDIKSLTTAMNNGLITSEELVNIYLERIEKYNTEFKAIIFINENAVKEAKELDKARKEGNIKGNLHGIPIIVKANIDVSGIPTTAGSKALAQNMPKQDAEVVKKLKEAGAIIIASANMSEFAFSAKDSRSSYGLVKNAFNPLYTSYGSSGGSAVGIALSFATAALGTDTNSSIRVPASASYLVGFRPTLNFLSLSGVIPYDTTRDVIGPITKTASDSAILMSIMSGIDYDKNITSDGLKGKTIGVATELYIGSNKASVIHNRKTYQPITDLIAEKIKKMEAAGAKIINIDKLYTIHFFEIARETMGGYTMCDGFTEYIKGTTGPIRKFEELITAPGKIYSLDGYKVGCNETKAINEKIKDKKSEYEEYIAKIFADNKLDAIMYPPTKNKLMLLNSETNTLNSPSTNMSSVIGYPAVSVPLGFDSDNLPYGVEFLGKKGTEDKLFEIISGYEALDSKIQVTSLAPSLYEIPQSVTLLVENYNRLLEIEKPNKKVRNLIEEIKEYFKNYQSDEKRETNAEELNIKINKELESKSYSIIDIVRTTLIILIVARIFLKIFIPITIKILRKNKKHKKIKK